MTAAPKYGSLWKSHGRDTSVCRTRLPWREAGVPREVTGECPWETRRGKGPSAYARIAEIMSGRAIYQQGLATTCQDPAYKGEPRDAGRKVVWRMSPTTSGLD